MPKAAPTKVDIASLRLSYGEDPSRLFRFVAAIETAVRMGCNVTLRVVNDPTRGDVLRPLDIYAEAARDA